MKHTTQAELPGAPAEIVGRDGGVEASAGTGAVRLTSSPRYFRL